MSATFKSVYALVDWHNVQDFAVPSFAHAPRKNIPAAVFEIQRQVALALQSFGGGADKYRVNLRIYHGWHKEREQTPLRRDFEMFASDPAMARRISNVSFVKGYQFGNELLCSPDAAPLYATFRSSGATGQKMIDSSIVCDLLHLFKTKTADIGMIISDDDDFVPAVLTARAWAANAILLRRPGSAVSHVTDMDCGASVDYWRN